MRSGALNLFRDLRGLACETFDCVFFATDHRYLGRIRFTDHCPERVAPPLRLIVGRALGLGADYLIAAHNHPDGQAVPSRSDLDFTRRLVQVLHPLNVRVADHLIMADTDVFSFRADGLL